MGIGEDFDKWRDETGTAMARGIEGAFGEVQDAADSFGRFTSAVGEAVGDAAEGVYRSEVEPALESAGKLGEAAFKGVSESPVGQAVGSVADTVGDVAGKLQDLAPDIMDTAALGLSSKLLNSAMGVAGGTAGQAASRVGVEKIGAADLRRESAGIPLPRPVATAAKTAAGVAKALAR